ncbi:MAG: hypothetical protein AAF433_13435 [Bacteroidota bacterium]
MKINKLLLLGSLFFGFASTTIAQSPMTTDADSETVSVEDYERMYESRFRVNLRSAVVNQLDLDPTEITDFTPLYFEYMSRKKDMVDQRERLMDEYAEEMQEPDQGKKEIENESADFIENYWEVDIAEMELRKDFFDRLEDKIGTKAALQFFVIEDNYRRQFTFNRLNEVIPFAIYLDPIYRTSLPEVDELNNWGAINIDGELSLDHEYTYQGLRKVLNATQAIANRAGERLTFVESMKRQILEKADMMREDWESTQHADYAREAFIMTANMMATLHNDTEMDIDSEALAKLRTAAEAIDPDRLYTVQTEAVHNFFRRAQQMVNDMVYNSNADIWLSTRR